MQNQTERDEDLEATEKTLQKIECIGFILASFFLFYLLLSPIL